MTTQIESQSQISRDDVNEEDDDGRETWSGRVSFWLAAVGSAVGLGNLWRFPWQCATWGGGAFIFAYFVALFTLGMPILTQELALGQKHRSGDIEAFGRMNWRLRGIGLASVIGAFGIVGYYMAVIGVSVVFFFESFFVPLPYGEGDGSYFLNLIEIPGGIHESQGIIAGKLYLATMLCWVVTFVCIMKGVKSASWAVKITMPLPFLLLFILLIKGATLPGSWYGIKQYFDFSNWDELSSPGIWNAAIGQCFFSLSVCMGVMTAYGSYNPKRQDIASDEKVISFLDVMASLMSGFAVYSVLGYLAKSTGSDDWFTVGGGGLVFVAFPVAIAQFQGANFFGIIFYFALFLLGIDSAFSMVEAVSTVFFDSDLNTYRLKWSRQKISMAICICGAFTSSLYCFDTGFYWLDVVDLYINNYGMVFLGICETGACGWFYQYHIIENQIGAISANLYRMGFWFSLIAANFFAFALGTPVEVCVEGTCVYEFTGTMGADSWIVGVTAGLVLWVLTIVVAYVKRSEHARKNLSFGKTLWYIVGWENADVLRDFINGNGIGDEAWKQSKYTLRGELYAMVKHCTIGIWWGFFIKYWLPVILSMTLIGTMRDHTYNPPFGMEWKYLSVGIMVFVSMVLVVFVVAIFPEYMTQSVDTTGEYDNLGKRDLPDDDEQATPYGDDAAAPAKQTNDVELAEADKDTRFEKKQPVNTADVVEEEETTPLQTDEKAADGDAKDTETAPQAEKTDDFQD